MASSNKHWPSMFKSKQCNTHHRKAPLSSGGGEKWTPEPKQRWNPKAEQIRILEAIFNSGMVNPAREEITKIRGELEEYGKVGDANVFYWFQNRKSRTKHKHKQRYLNNNNQNPIIKNQITTLPSSPPPILNTNISNIAPAVNNYNYVQQQQEMMTNNIIGNNNDGLSQDFGFSGLLSSGVQVLEHAYDQGNNNIGSCSSSLLFSDLMMMMNSSNEEGASSGEHHFDHHVPNSLIDTSITTTTTIEDLTTPLDVNQIQGAGTNDEAGGPLTSTVFINEIPFQVAVGPINLRECFGDDSVLLHSTGHPVLTNHCGLTLQPLQHGASYYLVPLFPLN